MVTVGAIRWVVLSYLINTNVYNFIIIEIQLLFWFSRLQKYFLPMVCCAYAIKNNTSIVWYIAIHAYFIWCSVKAMLLIIDCKYQLLQRSKPKVVNQQENEPFIENGNAGPTTELHLSKVNISRILLYIWINSYILPINLQYVNEHLP